VVVSRRVNSTVGRQKVAALITFIAGVAIGGLLSWLISHAYYKKAGREQKAEFDELSKKLAPRNTLSDFERMLEDSTWISDTINESQVWIANADNTFQIIRGERADDFRERWTDGHPDQSSARYPVYLRINNTIIKELSFISVDGGRIFVPMPEIRPLNGDHVEYFWNTNSLEVKVCKIIGSYYIYNDLAGVAQRSRITLVR
jgi:hypothetical protein